MSKTYASDIVNILYPEDILASEIEKSSDVSARCKLDVLLIIAIFVKELKLKLSKVINCPQPLFPPLNAC